MKIVIIIMISYLIFSIMTIIMHKLLFSSQIQSLLKIIRKPNYIIIWLLLLLIMILILILILRVNHLLGLHLWLVKSRIIIVWPIILLRILILINLVRLIKYGSCGLLYRNLIIFLF